MAPRKKMYNGFYVYMVETQQKLANEGKTINMTRMPMYCQNAWENMPDHLKETYKIKAKEMKNDAKTGKYTSIGENIEDVQKQSDESKFQTSAMYLYIEELVRMHPASHYLPKQKFIFIHINPYTCEKEGFYFPAEVSMVEFSLEKGLIRTFHQLIGFDQVRTKAPKAPTADINHHAANHHKINVYSMFPTNYTEILLKIIGFIMNKKVDEAVLNDSTLDMPPVYTAHTSIENELMITSASLYQLFRSAVKDADRDDFNNIIRVYHLDKLFMELKNVSHQIQNPETDDLALPSLAMATDCLSKDMFSIMKSVGCDYHEKLEQSTVCSNYFVCKWIHIISAHCCRYFNIKHMPGSHFDFDLSETESSIEKHFDRITLSTHAENFIKSMKINKSDDLSSNSFPALEGKLSTAIQKPIWNKPEQKANTNSKTITKKEDNFPPLGDVQKTIQKNAPITETNNWSKNAGHGKGITNHVQSNNQNKSNENLQKKQCRGRGLNIDKNK